MNSPSPTTSQIVEQYYKAWGTGDFDAMRPWLADDFEFEGPLQSSTGPDDYIATTKANAARFAGADYSIVHRVVEGEHAVVLASFRMGPATMHTAEHFRVHAGKIARVRLYFDPTPLHSQASRG